MTSQLRIAEDLDLPLDLVVQKMAILARSGAGKTSAAVDIAEELLEARQQVVVLDPPGAWWGLRTSANGKSAGYPIVVLGGVHGDLPLESTSGELIADLVVDQGLSMVLDLSEFSSDAEVFRFVEAFARRLYARKNRIRDPLLLVIEEADELAPQTVRPDQTKLLHAMERIAKRGRMRGIGFLAISQRSASLNWNVLSQVEVLIALQTTADLDVKAIDNWIKRVASTEGQEKRRQLLAEIAELPVGTGYIWSPGWLRMFRKLRFRRRRTFDSSATPEPGKRVVTPKTRADVDLEQLCQRLAATIEQAKADDPRELRKRVAELERQVRGASQAQVETKIERVEVPVLAQAQIDALAGIANAAAVNASELAVVADRLLEAAAQILEAINGKVPSRPLQRDTPKQPVARINQVPREHRRPSPMPAAPQPQRNAAAAEISGPEQKILDVLATLERLGLVTAHRSAVAAFAGYSHNGGRFQNLLGGLRSRSFIAYPSSGLLILTDSGRAIAQATADIQSIGDLHQAWYDQVGTSSAKVLRVLVESYPDQVSREELGERTGYEPRGGRFQNILGSLRTLQVIDYPSAGMVVATELLFPALPSTVDSYSIKRAN